MAGRAKVVLTDYVWESLDVEKKTLEGLAQAVNCMAQNENTPSQLQTLVPRFEVCRSHYCAGAA